MIELLIETSNLPVDGREFSFGEQRIWSDPIAEFQLPIRIAAPLTAEMRIQPHPDGCLIEGTIRGALVMACDRCVEEFEYALDVHFQEFEAYPGDEARQEDVWWIVAKDGLNYLNAAGFLWEQFQLALPEKPLCKVLCRGVCVTCGVNANLQTCDCDKPEPDARLAVFRSMKLS
ncbi:uncharacterized protein SAMN05660653_02436 [Desulfonatronum thiosulfatophilum]|uniref:DUF177 domain-containing protein n=1 Tax=Desulfonatronum thiosulfatophilum TaxID=617002 RepID=A0A1G6DX03_9BACT|nr:DUF177 domain-containing protein [Desulfonatronum thiosulfatophilum]SDB49709.1 uncharacterized protein SAMN05660653_02436 [Desulfonatronum thiosulfatophilum]